MMGETVVLGWLTLELTNSPFMVGAALSMRMLPLFFVGVPAGALAAPLFEMRWRVSGVAPTSVLVTSRARPEPLSIVFVAPVTLSVLCGFERPRPCARMPRPDVVSMSRPPPDSVSV